MKKINLAHLASEATTCAMTVIDNALGHTVKRSPCGEYLRVKMQMLIKDTIRFHFREGDAPKDIELEDEGEGK